MTKTSLCAVAVTLVALSYVTISGCKQRGDARGDSRTTLFSVCQDVYLAKGDTQDPPPVNLPKLIEWLDVQGFKNLWYVDYQQKTIRDGWGREIVIISQDGKFVGVGSAGPDGIWQGGNGDDVVYKLGDLKYATSNPVKKAS